MKQTINCSVNSLARVPRLVRIPFGRLFLAALLFSTVNLQISTLHAQGTAFTYQGRLNTTTGPATGLYDISFTLYNVASGGSAVGGPLAQSAVSVSNGLFNVTLDFGPGVFSGTVYYLELSVSTNGAGSYDTLSPRQQLTPSPYAEYASAAGRAGSVAATNITGTLPDTVLSANVALLGTANTFSGNQTITGGSLYLDNSQGVWAKNTSGTYEVCLWPRWSDNVTYLNYGAGGFNIRNNSSFITTMAMTDSGNVGMYGNVGIGTYSPSYPLSFASAIGDKISLFGGPGNHYGLGIQSYQMQIHSDTSLADIVFGYGQSSNLTETMRIKGSGNVGIGTNNPQGKLDVVANGRAIFVRPTAAAQSSYLEFDNAAGSFRGLLGVDGSGFSGAPTQLSIASWTSHPIGFFTAGAQRMTVGATGNVGIDTTAPGQLLEVGSGASGKDGVIRLNSGNGGAGRAWDIGVPYGGNTTTGRYYSFVIQDASVGVDRFLINWATGNVGINTDNPAATLDVNGNFAMGNGQWMQARNNTNGLENFLWPRWTDNATYLNYGAGGFNIRNNASTTTMSLDNSGNASILGSVSANKMNVNGSYTDAALTVFQRAGDNYAISVNGNQASSSSIFWTQVSDARLKQDIVPYQPGLGELAQLRTVRYRYRDNPSRGLTSKDKHIGVLAQEVQQVFPDAVLTEPDGTLALRPDPVFWASINAIQELNDKQQKAQGQIAKLQAENADLKARLEKLEQIVLSGNGAGR